LEPGVIVENCAIGKILLLRWHKWRNQQPLV
jgi:hypothetical protein